VSGGADRAIRVSTAVAVLGVAGIAAYVSYQHAFEVVRAHGESGLTAQLEPATIDGLVYSSSMVILYAARHRLPVPGLARWLLALGILATLAANVAHGWSDGPVGTFVAAWPAASLVGSYELLLWLIRSAAGSMICGPVADQMRSSDDDPSAELGLVSKIDSELVQHLATVNDGTLLSGPGNCYREPTVTMGQASKPGRGGLVRASRSAYQETASSPIADVAGGGNHYDIDEAAVAAYRASIASGSPLSERKLAAMFGRTSRRWARCRMAEARQACEPP